MPSTETDKDIHLLLWCMAPSNVNENEMNFYLIQHMDPSGGSDSDTKPEL